MGGIRIYTTQWCGFCSAAKALLDRAGLPYEEISLDDDPGFRQRLLDETGGWTVPQITVGSTRVGGYSELKRLGLERLRDLAAAA
jgi:glutaredoxin 3